MLLINLNSINQGIKHIIKIYGMDNDSRNFLEGTVLTFDNPDSLGWDGSRKIMTNPFSSAKKTEVWILKFYVFIASNANDLVNFFSLFKL